MVATALGRYFLIVWDGGRVQSCVFFLILLFFLSGDECIEDVG